MKRAASLTVAAAVVAILLATRDGSIGSAQAAVQGAAAKTLGAGSSRLAMTFNAPGLPTKTSEYAVEGLMDYVHHRGRITYGRDTEVLFDGHILYMRWPLPWRPDSPWVRYETGSNDSDPFDLYERAMRNPIELLGFLTSGSSDVRDVGTEDVRGMPTTHYEGTLDLQRVVDKAPPERRAELQAWLNVIAENESMKVPFGLWIDRDGVAHRLRIDQDGGASVTIEYYDFGVPVEVKPPPANEIMGDDELTREIEQHARDARCDDREVASGEDSAKSPSDDVAPSADTSSWYSGGIREEAEAGSADAVYEICLGNVDGG